MSVTIGRCLIRLREENAHPSKEHVDLSYYALIPLEDLTLEQMESLDTPERPLAPLITMAGAERLTPWTEGGPYLADVLPEGHGVFRKWFERGWGAMRKEAAV